MTRTVLVNCPIKAEIRAVDSQSDLRILLYRIYSINRPERLLNFWTLRVGAYSRWALIRGWALTGAYHLLALIKFSVFSASVVCLFCNKTINGNDKMRRCNRVRFL